MDLIRSDPFQDVDRFMQQLWAGQNESRSVTMPLDAYRKDDVFLIRLDLPGVTTDSIDVTVEDDVLTINATREAPPSPEGIKSIITERPFGTFTRQVFLGTNLDTENMRAEYEAGVLTLTIPVAEHAKPRRIEIATHSDPRELSP